MSGHRVTPAAHPVAQVGHVGTGSIKLTVNGETKQDAHLDELIWPVAEVIAHVSRAYRLEPGDLIYTGTPAGVGAVVTGDVIIVSIAGLSDTIVTIGPRADD